MGGRLGRKGTTPEVAELALRLGYKPVAPARAERFLRSLPREISIVAAAGQMGEEAVRGAGLERQLAGVVGARRGRTSREDTISAAREMMRLGVELVVFVGGDGTAKDVYDAVGPSLPILGVPSGVKVYSGVFAYTPEDAAEVVRGFSAGVAEIGEAEILDVDEEELKRDRLVLRVYGVARTPRVPGLLQPTKSLGSGPDDEENKVSIAKFLREEMKPGALYILGPGSTVKALRHFVEGGLSLLGVDAVKDGKVVLRDAWERPLLELLERHSEAYVVVTPIGGQGFIFGRGNQQISPGVLRRIPRDHIIVVATWSKISSIDYLRVDTGDPELDKALRGYYRVLVDYGKYVIKKAI